MDLFSRDLIGVIDTEFPGDISLQGRQAIAIDTLKGNLITKQNIVAIPAPDSICTGGQLRVLAKNRIRQVGWIDIRLHDAIRIVALQVALVQAVTKADGIDIGYPVQQLKGFLGVLNHGRGGTAAITTTYRKLITTLSISVDLSNHVT